MIVQHYFDRFGDDGDFDRRILDGPENAELMRAALERGSPVTEEDIKTAYERTYSRPYPAADLPDDAIT